MKRIALFICLISVLLFSSVAHATIISGAKKSGDYEYTISGNEATIVYYTGNYKTSTTIPSTLGGKKVTTIAWGVFSCLWKLESVTIPDSVVTIHDEAFLNSTGLKTVNIGKGVKKITGNPFDGCTSLKTINVSSQNTYLQVINGVLFTKNPKRLVCYPATKTANTYTLPHGVVELGDRAFCGNPYLKTLVIPASVKTIHKTAFNDGYGKKQNITLDVSQNEYAKSYAIKNNMKYVESVDKKTAKKTAAPTAKATGNSSSSTVSSPYAVGSYITFGKWEQDNNKSNGSEAIKWKVLAVENDRILVITENVIEVDRYAQSNSIVDGMNEVNLNWKTSFIRQWLNNSFLAAFSNEEKSKICSTTVETKDASGKQQTTDTIFLLSSGEAKKYFTSAKAMAAKPSIYAKNKMSRKDAVSGQGYCTWWLRDMYDVVYDAGTYRFMESTYNEAYFVSFDKGVANEGGLVGIDYHYGIRPAMWIKTKTTENETNNTASSKSSVQTIKKPTSYTFLKATLLSIGAKATAKDWCSDGLRETAIMTLAIDYLRQSGASQMKPTPESTFIGYKDEVLYAVIPVIEGETVFFEMDTEYETCKYCIYDGIDAVRNEQIIASNCAKNYWGTEWKAMESALYALLK